MEISFRNTSPKLFAHYIEKEIQEAILLKDAHKYMDSLEALSCFGLGFRNMKVHNDVTDVARYVPKENLLVILDKEEKEKVDQQLFDKGIREDSNEEIFYKSITSCAHFYSRGILGKKEGIVPKIEVEGWTSGRNEKFDSSWFSGLRMMNMTLYGWGPGWKGAIDDSFDYCFKRWLEVPKKEIIKSLTLEEVMERVKPKNDYVKFKI